MSTIIHPQVAADAAPLSGARNPAAAISGIRSSTPAESSHSGIWVGIFAITMSFVAFTSALFVREGTTDWSHLTLPNVLYGNTLVLLVSSATLEMARRSIFVGREFHSGVERRGSGWLLATLALGLIFVAGQYAAWTQLSAQGLYLSTNPNSSFFYVLTAVHAVHLLCGVLALAWLVALRIGKRSTMRRRSFESTAIYWHFMTVLWVYLLVILRTKL
ncbi:MAG: cytochrome c oxidase subunit 3 [Candidatus Acidiferrum sp.]